MVSLVVNHHGAGLFVPKPSSGEDRPRCSTPDLGRTVRECPLVFTTVGGGRYSVIREPVAVVTQLVTQGAGPYSTARFQLTPTPGVPILYLLVLAC